MKWFITTHFENEQLSGNHLIFPTMEHQGCSEKNMCLLLAANCDSFLSLWFYLLSSVHNTVSDVMSSPAVVGSTVPIAVLTVPVWVLAMHWIWTSWGLRAPNTVLILSLDMGESLTRRENKRFEMVSHLTRTHGWSLLLSLTVYSHCFAHCF